jgi:hypothetical protein
MNEIIARNILLFGLVTILSNGLDLSNKIIPRRKTSLQSTVALKHLHKAIRDEQVELQNGVSMQ